MKEIVDKIGSIASEITGYVVDGVGKAGLQVTSSWGRLFSFFIAIFIIYIGTKVAQPLLKFVLIIVGIILVLGMVLPIW